MQEVEHFAKISFKGKWQYFFIGLLITSFEVIVKSIGIFLAIYLDSEILKGK